jgi:phage-related protein
MNFINSIISMILSFLSPIISLFQPLLSAFGLDGILGQLGM